MVPERSERGFNGWESREMDIVFASTIYYLTSFNPIPMVCGLAESRWNSGSLLEAKIIRKPRKDATVTLLEGERNCSNERQKLTYVISCSLKTKRSFGRHRSV